ncbi:site-specific integrase, partial [Mammaliicoccus vitulinus]
EDNSIAPYALRHTHTCYLLSKYIPIEYISNSIYFTFIFYTKS